MESTMSFVLVFAFCASSSPRKPFVAALIFGLNMLILYPLSRGFINLPFYLGASIVEGNFRLISEFLLSLVPLVNGHAAFFCSC